MRTLALMLAALAACAEPGDDAPAPPPPPIDAPARLDGAVDAERQALGERYAQATGIKLYSHHRKHLGNRDGVFAPLVATADGGVVVIGTHVTPRRGRAGISLAVAARIDATGAEVWRRDFAMKGFAESEGGSAALVDGGVVLFVLEYVNPAWGAVTRLVKLDDAGATQWEWIGRGKGGADTPFADVLFNGQGFTFSVAPLGQPATADIENTFTHELGHLVGFDHNPDPTSTMYAEAAAGEIAKRDLTADDAAGMCAVYALGQEPDLDEGGCGCGTSPTPGAGAAALGVAAVLVRRRRRR